MVYSFSLRLSYSNNRKASWVWRREVPEGSGLHGLRPLLCLWHGRGVGQGLRLWHTVLALCTHRTCPWHILGRKENMGIGVNREGKKYEHRTGHGIPVSPVLLVFCVTSSEPLLCWDPSDISVTWAWGWMIAKVSSRSPRSWRDGGVHEDIGSLRSSQGPASIQPTLRQFFAYKREQTWLFGVTNRSNDGSHREWVSD